MQKIYDVAPAKSERAPAWVVIDTRNGRTVSNILSYTDAHRQATVRNIAHSTIAHNDKIRARKSGGSKA